MKKTVFMKATSAVTACVLLFSSVTFRAEGRVPAVTVDSVPYTGNVHMVGNTTYVSLREFAERTVGGLIEWDGKSKTATVTVSDTVTSVGIGKKYIISGSRAVSCPSGIMLKNDKTVVPLRAIADIFGYSTSWNGETFSAFIDKISADGKESGNTFSVSSPLKVKIGKGSPSVSAENIPTEDSRHTASETLPDTASTPSAVNIQPDAPAYTEEDLYWLSRIIHAEAGGESFEGKLAVGTVVMNRVACKDFPNTVYGVIFDTAGGVQFSPVLNGTVYSAPDSDSTAAAIICLEGNSGLGKDILFFLNPDKAQSRWITESRTYVSSIGNHDFYA